MKLFLITLAIFLATQIAKATSPHPILAAPLPRIFFQKVDIPNTLEFFRMKGTEELRRQTGDPTAVLKFDYEFDPSTRQSTTITYEKQDTIYGAALREVLDQLNLSVEATAFDRMRIFETPLTSLPTAPP